MKNWKITAYLKNALVFEKLKEKFMKGRKERLISIINNIGKRTLKHSNLRMLQNQTVSLI